MFLASKCRFVTGLKHDNWDPGISAPLGDPDTEMWDSLALLHISDFGRAEDQGTVSGIERIDKPSE